MHNEKCIIKYYFDRTWFNDPPYVQNGDTALHLAVRKGRMDVVEALVQCAADLTLRNKVGDAALFVSHEWWLGWFHEMKWMLIVIDT